MDGTSRAGKPGGDGMEDDDMAAVAAALKGLDAIAGGSHTGGVADEYAAMLSDVETVGSRIGGLDPDTILDEACSAIVALMDDVAEARTLDGGDLESHREESRLLHSIIAQNLIAEATGRIPDALASLLGWVRSDGRQGRRRRRGR